MEIQHLILGSYSLAELESLLDANAKNGYKLVSFTSSFNSDANAMLYNSVMVKYGSDYESKDILVQIYEKLDSIDSQLISIESNTN